MSLEEFNIIKLDQLAHSLTEFSIYRTRENLQRPVFMIYSNDVDRIKKLLDYIIVWIGSSIKKITINCTDKINLNDIDKKNIFIFNMSDNQVIKNESKILNSTANKIVTGHLMTYLFENCGPMIFIGSKSDDIPSQVRSCANAVFIDNIDEWRKLINLQQGYQYEKEGIIVVDHMPCWNKLSVLKNIF
jgi:hypothetical protein